MPMPMVPPMATANPKVTPRTRSSLFLRTGWALTKACSVAIASVYLILNRGEILFVRSFKSSAAVSFRNSDLQLGFSLRGSPVNWAL